MAPREKANQIYNKMVVDFKIDKWQSKQCALSAVDIIIDNAGYIWGGHDTETGLSSRDSYRKYWNEVKEEIQKI